MRDYTKPEPVRVWAVRRKGNGKVVTRPSHNPWVVLAEVARRGHHRYEIVHADLVPTEWESGQ